MSNPLNVIALISGGKDSLFSILHCRANGHKVVALANLYPAPARGKASTEKEPDDGEAKAEEEEQGAEEDDLNSYMYQTVGHSVIPLYEQALGIPLYRQEILGRAVVTARDYCAPGQGGREQKWKNGNEEEEGNGNDEDVDETESLLPLLRKVLLVHPSANALSTGAILSTYQRTRVESIALRLGLVPLSYLWQYPLLPPYLQSGLLHDMAAVGMDARIIKVASGGLDASFLWENVADKKVVGRMSRAMGRFGENGDGAVLGEGGEFETLAVDGPRGLFKRKIVVEEGNVVTGEGGSAVFRWKGARLVEKEEGRDDVDGEVRIPEVWDQEFKEVLDAISPSPLEKEPSESQGDTESSLLPPISLETTISSTPTTLTLSNLTSTAPGPPTVQLQSILQTLRTHLATRNLTPSCITHITLLLRHISDFSTLNPIYSTLFTSPNPPSRVTIACGNRLPKDVDVVLSAVICNPEPQQKSASDIKSTRNALHVQSHSYWAPANIGPYSQAISTPLPLSPSSHQEHHPALVHPAGQIPLVPSSMTPLQTSFPAQTTLALQHLWRIGRAMKVNWWTCGIAYISSCPTAETASRVETAQKVWRKVCEKSLLSHSHSRTSTSTDGEAEDEDEPIDPWDLANLHRNPPTTNDLTYRAPIPDPSALASPSIKPPPCFVAQIAQLPREVDIEWHSLGLSAARVSLRSTHEAGITEVVGTPTRVFWMEVREGEDVGGRLKGLFGGESVVWEEVVVYAGPALGGEWRGEGIGSAVWVPCFGVWGAGGREVAGVVVGRVSVSV